MTLHAAAAIFLTTDLREDGDQQPVWAFVVLAGLANLVAIVMHMAKATGDGDGDDVDSSPSDLALKLQERPEECIVYLLLGIFCPEALTFLTSSQSSHMWFRKLSLIGAFLEDLPVTFVLFTCERMATACSGHYARSSRPQPHSQQRVHSARARLLASRACALGPAAHDHRRPLPTARRMWALPAARTAAAPCDRLPRAPHRSCTL